MADEVLAKSFELIGTEYDRYRPGFPRAALDVVCPGHVRAALDLGAGTGKFTALLADRAERVIAVEPSAAMISVLHSMLPDVEAMLGSAESIPVESASIDLVTVAQAFHWFDREPACAEIARVLVRGGALGLIWNHSDPECSWDTAAHRIAHPAVSASDDTTSSAAEQLPGFEFVRREQVRWVERIDREAYLKRWSTVSTFLVADDATRSAMSAQIEAVLDADPQTRGRAEFDLPVVTDVYLYRGL